MLPPDTLELGRSVFSDLGLDVFDVTLIEGGGLAILENHEIEVLLRREGQASEDFQRGARHTTFVGAGILEENDPALLERHARLLSEEEVGAFDDVLVVRLALRIDQTSNIRNVHCLRTTENEYDSP